MAIDIIASVVPDIAFASCDEIRFYVYLTPRISCSGREPLENFRHIYNWPDYFEFFNPDDKKTVVKFNLYKSSNLQFINSISAIKADDKGYRGDLWKTRDWEKPAERSRPADHPKWAKTVWRSLVNKSTPVDGWEPDRNAYKLLGKLDLQALNDQMNRTIITYKQKLLSTSLKELKIPGFYDSPEDEEEQRAGLLTILNHLLTLSADRKLASPYINNPSKAISFPSFLQELHDKLQDFKQHRTQELKDLSLKLSLKQIEERNSTETNEFHKKMAAFGNFPFLLKQCGWIWSYTVKKEEFYKNLDSKGNSYFIQVSFVRKRPADPAICCTPDKIADFIDNVRFSYPYTSIAVQPSGNDYSVDYGFKAQDKDFKYLNIEGGLIDTGNGRNVIAEYLEKNQVFDRITDILQQKYKFGYRADQPADSSGNQQKLQTIAAGQTPQSQQEINVLNHERIHSANLNSGRQPTTDYNSVGVSVSLQNLKHAVQTAITNSPGLNFSGFGIKPPVQQNVEASAILYGHNLHKGFRADVFPVQASPSTGAAPPPRVFDKGRSLCKRRTYYTIDFGKDVPPDADSIFVNPGCLVDEDEGWIVESAQGSNSGSLYVDGEIFRYNDWSLCADKLIRSTDDSINQNALSVQANSNIRIYSIPQEKSLPRLRYGRAYDIVLRYVDICGSGRTISLKPGDPLDGTYPCWFAPPDPGNQVTRLTAYPRTQGIGAPLAFLSTALHEGGLRTNPYLDERLGEDLTTLVIRSTWNSRDGKFECDQESTRYLAPPKLEFHLAKKHGVLDALMKQMSIDPDNPRVKKASEKIMSLTTYSQQPKRLDNQEDHSEETVTHSKDIDYLFDPLVRGYQAFINGRQESEWPLFSGIDPKLDCTDFGKTWLDRVKYLQLTLANDKDPDPYDYNITARGDYGQRIALQEGMEKDIEIQASVFKSLLTPDDAGQEFPVKSLFYDDIATYRLKMRLVHAVQKPCLLYTQLNKSNFKSIYDASIGVGDRAPGETTVNMKMSFVVFPCLTVETYVLHVSYVDKVSYRKKLFPDGSINKLGYQNVQTTKIIKTGINPDRQGIEQMVDFSGLAHTFNDSKYRRVFYQLEAVSKFKKYFPAKIKDFSVYGAKPAAIVPTGKERTLPQDDLDKIIATWQPILSSNPPPALTVDRIVPLIRWEGKSLSTGLQRKCDTIRIYFEGDWYASGGHDKDESVAIFFVERPPRTGQIVNSQYVPVELENVISQMGVDPAADVTIPPTDLPLIDRGFFYESNGTQLPLVTFVQCEEIVMTRIQNLDFANKGINPYADYDVSAAIYKVHFMPPEGDDQQGRFYVDVRINHEEHMQQQYFPFIRFAIARYQPNTIDTLKANPNAIDFHFSRVSVTDFVQLLPYRKISLSDGGDLTYTAPATRRSEPSPRHLQPNKLVYHKGGNQVAQDATLIDLTKQDIFDRKDAGTVDTIIATGVKLADPFVVEEYEVYTDQPDVKLADGLTPRENYTNRLILTYTNTPQRPL